MIKRIREYMEYRNNVKIAKREMAKIMATTLPVVNKVSDKSKDIADCIINITNTSKGLDGKELLEVVLDEVSKTLLTNNERLIEIGSYMAQLSREDIHKILVHSIVETMDIEE